jgi:hypothetical protein
MDNKNRCFSALEDKQRQRHYIALISYRLRIIAPEPCRILGQHPNYKSI